MAFPKVDDTPAITVSEAKKVLKIGSPKLYELIDNDYLPSFKIGRNRYLRKKDVEDLMLNWTYKRYIFPDQLICEASRQLTNLLIKEYEQLELDGDLDEYIRSRKFELLQLALTDEVLLQQINKIRNIRYEPFTTTTASITSSNSID